MINRYFNSVLILICLPLGLIAQKNFAHNFPQDLNNYTLLIERIPLQFMKNELRERDSTAIAIEFEKIQDIQELYLVQVPKFSCLLLSGDEIDRVSKSNPELYRYVLKFKVTKKKINKVSEEVISFYFRDLERRKNFKLIGIHSYNTKASLVLIYGRVRRMYTKPMK
ncbi:MAG: hypothetical protein JKX74_09715 [Flavobacteriales bacterium]|nr:hypothetical protein [Flavobacteriales bacterium]